MQTQNSRQVSPTFQARIDDLNGVYLPDDDRRRKAI
jgi:hypothetical protein